MANEYLKRTPTSTGNTRVFTWSGWIKINSLTGTIRLFKGCKGLVFNSSIQRI